MNFASEVQASKASSGTQGTGGAMQEEPYNKQLQFLQEQIQALEQFSRQIKHNKAPKQQVRLNIR